MKELINFSVYSFSLSRFNGDWRSVQKYVNDKNLDGLELLISHQPLAENLPESLVVGVHLPILITWLDVWYQDGLPPGVDPAYWHVVCSGGNRKEIVDSQRRVWEQAAALGASYAVFHVASVSLEESFTQNFCSTHQEVIKATAELLNEIAQRFPEGEPPVRLFLENLWWPGLTFLDNNLAEDLADRLKFDNWGFVFDTAHLLNTQHALENEDQAVDFILETYQNLSPQIQKRIEGLHLNSSLTGSYQRRTIAEGIPPEWRKMSFEQQWEKAKKHVGRIDQHHPFRSERIKEVVYKIKPEYLTHELANLDPEEFDSFLRIQRQALT